MNEKEVLEILKKERFKHSRDFKPEFMKDWSDGKIEQFYAKNEVVLSALDYAIKCVNSIHRFRLVNEDLTQIFSEIEWLGLGLNWKIRKKRHKLTKKHFYLWITTQT